MTRQPTWIVELELEEFHSALRLNEYVLSQRFDAHIVSEKGITLRTTWYHDVAIKASDTLSLEIGTRAFTFLSLEACYGPWWELPYLPYVNVDGEEMM